MNVQDAIEARTSVKEYRPTPVPRDRIERLLELAHTAPNHRMTQPLAYRVMGAGAKTAYAKALAGRKTAKLDDPETARAVRERVLARTTSVPVMIAVLVHEDEDPEIREEDYATAFMAIENMSLAALDMGLGTHIKTGAVMGEASLREALEADPDQRIAAVVFLGEPAELPDPKPRAPAADRTRWLE
jgi:nitroreductase